MELFGARTVRASSTGTNMLWIVRVLLGKLTLLTLLVSPPSREARQNDLYTVDVALYNVAQRYATLMQIQKTVMC